MARQWKFLFLVPRLQEAEPGGVRVTQSEGGFSEPLQNALGRARDLLRQSDQGAALLPHGLEGAMAAGIA